MVSLQARRAAETIGMVWSEAEPLLRTAIPIANPDGVAE